MVYLNHWAFTRRYSSPYQAPEAGDWCLVGAATGHPEKKAAHPVTTSPIRGVDQRLRLVKTMNTTYVLLDPSPEWLADVAENGHTIGDFFNMFEPLSEHSE